MLRLTGRKQRKRRVTVPAYIKSLARTVSEAEFDRRVSHLLRDFGADVDVSRLEPLSLAREVWTRVVP